MNAFSRKKLAATDLPSGDAPADTYQNSRNAQDSRILDAVQNAKQWRRNGNLLCVIAVVSVAGNIYQGVTNKLVPYVIREDRYSNVMGPGVVLEGAIPVTDGELSAVARSFIRNIRTRYADADAMRANIFNAYDHTVAGSPAATRLDTMFRVKDPFDQVKRELVSVQEDHAASVDVVVEGAPRQTRSYRVEWKEAVTPRDGSPVPPVANKVAVVSMRVIPPKTDDAREKNPRGIYVYEFTGWDQ